MTEAQQAAERAADDIAKALFPGSGGFSSIAKQRAISIIAPLLAAKDAEISRLNELLSVYAAWKDGIESSGDVDGWATAFTWKKTQLAAEADRDRLAADLLEAMQLLKRTKDN